MRHLGGVSTPVVARLRVVAVWSVLLMTAAQFAFVPPARAATSVPAMMMAAAQADDDPFTAEFEEQQVGYPDPWEEFNRGVLTLNQELDDWVFEPVALGYRALVPDPLRAAIHRVFSNFGSVTILLNDALQGQGDCVAATATRLMVNSTVGLGGTIDVAKNSGVPAHSNDFGATLWSYGVDSGPYLMLPVFGPSTARDGFGTIVDTLSSPPTYVLGVAQRVTYGGGYGIALREEYHESLTALEESSVDFYAALRNAYYQSRSAEPVWQNNCGGPAAESGAERARRFSYRCRRRTQQPCR